MKRLYQIMGGWMMARGRMRADDATMRRLEYGSMVQRLGVRFTERLRDAWRRRWIRKTNDATQEAKRDEEGNGGLYR